MQKLIVFVCCLAGICLLAQAQNAAKPESGKTAKKTEKVNPLKLTSKNFFVFTAPPEGWVTNEDTLRAHFKLYGLQYQKPRRADQRENTRAIIYADYYAKGNGVLRTSKEYITKETTITDKEAGTTKTEPTEATTLAGRKATQFYRGTTATLPLHDPKGIKTKIIEHFVVVDDVKKEGFYVFRLYADDASYIEANKTFEELLKTLKLLR